MKYETAPAFDADIKRLTKAEFKLFRDYINSQSIWPKSLRIKPVQGARGIFEMTWSFSGPDGRATFEWKSIDGKRGVSWRRVGGHQIFKQP